MTSFRKRPGSGTAATIFIFVLLTITVSGLEGQDSARVSATMLRVLAEAADGNRTGRPVFFVADHRFPHQVLGPFGTRDEAQAVRADSGSNFSVFGPYTTPRGPDADTTSRVVGIRLTIMTPRGRQTIDLDRREVGKVDAIFLSPAATDKFVIPYYGRLYGPKYAQTLRERLDRVGMIICHIRPSYLCTPRPDGLLNLIRVMEPGMTAPY